MSIPATTAHEAAADGSSLQTLLTARGWGALQAWATLSWLAPLVILHGLLYVVLVPPWQHYDEPAHFLYAAGVAAGELDAPGLTSAMLSREIADSMHRFRFFAPGTQPPVLAPVPPEVGVDQRGHPPLYYAVVAVALRPFAALSVEEQLYAARAVSLIFYTLTVLTAWRIAVALAPDEPLVQLAVPLLTMLTPAFADIMAAVNNDVLLNFSLAAALLGAVLLVRDGPRPLALALALLGAAVGILTKRTAVFALVPLLLALFWSVWRAPLRWWVLPLATVSTALVAAIVALEPSAGGGGPLFVARPWLADLSRDYLRVPVDDLLRSLSDPSRVGDRYWALLQVAFSGYYTHFAWGNLALHPAWVVSLAILACLAVVGLIAGAARAGAELALWQRRCLWLFTLCVAVAWASLFMRLHPLPPLTEAVYIPRARYMFWTVIPTLWLFMAGLSWAAPAHWRRAAIAGLVCFFVCLDLAAWMWALIQYFYQ